MQRKLDVEEKYFIICAEHKSWLVNAISASMASRKWWDEHHLTIDHVIALIWSDVTIKEAVQKYGGHRTYQLNPKLPHLEGYGPFLQQIGSGDSTRYVGKPQNYRLLDFIK